MNPQGGRRWLDVNMLFGEYVDVMRLLLWLSLFVIVVVIIIALPLPGRGPGILARWDPWRGFKSQARRTVFVLAGHRCEGPFFFLWGRCRRAAEQIDHVYPWSKSGATVVSNGQALCTGHNRRKSNWTPPWWYVLSLERRRRKYYPAGTSVTVRAALGPADRAARAAWAERKQSRSNLPRTPTR